MFALVRSAVVIFLLLTVVTGLAYPLFVTAIAQVVFPSQANGSLIEPEGKPVGSRLIGQPFQGERYFWGRPSATGPVAYNAAAGSGAERGPHESRVREAVAKRVETLRAADPGKQEQVPIDLVTSSASGLDPHISPAAALYQVPRIARLAKLEENVVRNLVERHIEKPTFGMLGESRVNVLQLNLGLEHLAKFGHDAEK